MTSLRSTYRYAAEIEIDVLKRNNIEIISFNIIGEIEGLNKSISGKLYWDEVLMKEEALQCELTKKGKYRIYSDGYVNFDWYALDEANVNFNLETIYLNDPVLE